MNKVIQNTLPYLPFNVFKFSLTQMYSMVYMFKIPGQTSMRPCCISDREATVATIRSETLEAQLQSSDMATNL